VLPFSHNLGGIAFDRWLRALAKIFNATSGLVL